MAEKENIYQKIAAVMNEVQYLAKDDHVKFQNTNYKAMSEEKVTSVMREKMLAHGLIVYPESMQTSRTNNITHCDVIYKMVNIENPSEQITIASCGDGADTQDKGSGKAMTYAFKYMWLRTFAIPTGEDPDKICNEEIEANLKKDADKKKAAEKAKADEAAKAEEKKRKEETKPAAVVNAELRETVMKYCNNHYTADQIKQICARYKVNSLNELSNDNCIEYKELIESKGGDINK